MRALALLVMLSGLLAILPAGQPRAQDIVADLSQRAVAITANFDGSELMIFGAVRRDAPLEVTGPVDVLITVTGPSTPVTVRRKDRIAGIWINAQRVEVDAAPSFYAIASSAPLNTILSDTEDLRHKITIPRAIRSVGAPQDVADAGVYTEALIRIREDNGLYRSEESIVDLREQTLFRTRIALPANLVEGDYAVRIFLTRDRQVIAHERTAIAVRKVGLERFIYRLAHDQPLLYGVLSLAIAITAGWSASAIFRYLQN
jgi:uncharacterized protein (TIGR02186 family)